MNWDKVEDFVASFALYYSVYVRIECGFREVVVCTATVSSDGTQMSGGLQILGRPHRIVPVSEVNDIYFTTRGHAAPYFGKMFRSVAQCGHVWFANEGEIAQVSEADAESTNRPLLLWRHLRSLGTTESAVVVGVFSVRGLYDLLPTKDPKWML